MAKYTDEMVTVIENFSNDYEGTVSYADFVKFHADFEEEYGETFKLRSLGAKMRHMGIALEPKSSVKAVKQYSEADEAQIQGMCNDPDNLPFLEQIAEAMGRSEKSISGKLVSMGIYGVKKEHLKTKAPKLFTADDEVKILEMCADENNLPFIEELADALGKEAKQVRGKLAGMRIKGILTRDKVAAKGKIYTDEVVAEIKAALEGGKTVEEIASERNLNPRGMLTTLTKLGVIAKKVKAVFWNDSRVEKVKEMVAAGSTREDIASALNTTVMVICKKSKDLGLTLIKAEV